MAQSLSRNLIHLVFSTKNRTPILDPEIHKDLHRYTATILQDLQSPALAINSVSDHIHILFDLNKNHALAPVIRQIKRNSSIWLRKHSSPYKAFRWQKGYGAFSIGQSAVSEVKTYISKQPEHHRRKTFQQEFLTLLKRYEIAYDERYLWD